MNAKAELEVIVSDLEDNLRLIKEIGDGIDKNGDVHSVLTLLAKATGNISSAATQIKMANEILGRLEDQVEDTGKPPTKYIEPLKGLIRDILNQDCPSCDGSGKRRSGGKCKTCGGTGSKGSLKTSFPKPDDKFGDGKK